ncbi:MAG: glycosyltransferase family 4 protein [Solirubrobacteraceae bacterium]|nr:glycosyltransferase family 4 protein [Solirubrobacteraceae bacterium]
MRGPVEGSTVVGARPAAARPSLRIGFVAWRDLAHPQAGGSEVVVDRYLRGLQQRGHHVQLMCGGPAGLRPYEVHELGGTYAQYLRAPITHAKKFRDVDVLVDVQNGIPFFSPLWRRKPSICLVHHVHTEQWGMTFPAPVAAVGRTLEGTLMPLAYRRRPYVAVSPGTAEELAKLGIPEGQISVVTNGVELASPTAPRSEEPMFLALGRLVPHKRIDLLLKLWEQVRPHTGGRLVIAGDGPMLPALREQAGEGVELLGSVSESTKADLLSQAWLLTHPASHEGWGMVVLEAAMMRTPTLAFDVPGVRDTVCHSRTGWLMGDTAGFADQWITAAHDASLRERVGVEARSWAEGFTWDRSIDRLERLLLEAAGRGVEATTMGVGEMNTTPTPFGSPTLAAAPSGLSPNVAAALGRSPGPARP